MKWQSAFWKNPKTAIRCTATKPKPRHSASFSLSRCYLYRHFQFHEDTCSEYVLNNYHCVTPHTYCSGKKAECQRPERQSPLTLIVSSNSVWASQGCTAVIASAAGPTDGLLRVFFHFCLLSFSLTSLYWSTPDGFIFINGFTFYSLLYRDLHLSKISSGLNVVFQ